MHYHDPKYTIFREGDDGDAFYYIITGKVTHYVQSSINGKYRLNNVAESKEGDCFGELGILYGIKRNSSAITTSYVELLSLSKENYDKEIKGDALVIHQKAINFFKKNEILNVIPDDIMLEIVNKCKKPIEFKSNEVMLKQGVKSDYVYFIIKGNVKLLKRVDFKKSASFVVPNPPNNEDYLDNNFATKLVEVKQLTRGESVGIYELLRNLPSVCSAIATMPTSCYKMSLQDFKIVDSLNFQIIQTLTEPYPDDDDLRKSFLQSLK